jgi:transcriptional regulator with GAF, ATPase, and Fis domain
MAQVAAGERAAGVPVTLDVSAFQRWHATRAAVFDGAAAPAAAATPVASPATGASPPAGGDDDRLIPAGAGGAARRTSAERPILGEQARLLKREDVLRALEQSNGNQAAAARLLGVARNTLLKRIKQFEIPPDHGAPR